MADERQLKLIAHHQAKIFQWERVAAHLDERIRAGLRASGLDCHQQTHRVKGQQSFIAKAMKLRPDGRFKYDDPTVEIHDFVGLRLVVALADDIPAVAAVVREHVRVYEEADRGREDLAAAPGYQSLHLIARLRDDDPVLVSYPALAGDICIEIQIRSILQDAYASFHHDIAYKTERPVTPATERRLRVLASVLHLADEEFARVRAHAVADGVPEAASVAVDSGRWTAEGVAAAVRDHVGPGEDDPIAWLSEYTTVLDSLGIGDRAALDALLPASSGDPGDARRLRTARPWARGVQVLDVMLQTAMGDAYLDARARHLSAAAAEDLRAALTAEAGERGR